MASRLPELINDDDVFWVVVDKHVCRRGYRWIPDTFARWQDTAMRRARAMRPDLADWQQLYREGYRAVKVKIRLHPDCEPKGAEDG